MTKRTKKGVGASIEQARRGEGRWGGVVEAARRTSFAVEVYRDGRLVDIIDTPSRLWELLDCNWRDSPERCMGRVSITTKQKAP